MIVRKKKKKKRGKNVEPRFSNQLWQRAVSDKNEHIERGGGERNHQVTA